jgi:hypothetical protein
MSEYDSESYGEGYGDGSGQDGTTTDTADATGGSDVPDTDVDGHAAKKHGDYFVEVGEPQRALGYYQEALNKGDLDALETEKVHYNMASCYYQLGDQQNCYPHAYAAAKSSDTSVETYALRYFFWSVTGETVGGI